MTQKFAFIKKSGNRKTGVMSTTYSDSANCPSNCAWKDKACYARFSWTGVHWSNSNLTFSEMCRGISEIPDNQIWRHNVGGDLPGIDNVIDLRKLKALVKANGKSKGFTYTHKPVGTTGLGAKNAKAIKSANANGFTINLSADSFEQADELLQLNIAPVTVVVDSNTSVKNLTTSGGNKIVVCPAQTKEITCAKCKLCANPNRKVIIGFKAHGAGKKLVNLRLSKND